MSLQSARQRQSSRGMFQSSITSLLVALSAVLALSVASGCAGKKASEDTSTVPNAAAADENATGDSDSGRAMGLQTVHFPYDSNTLDSEAKSTIKSNADILKDKSTLKVQIEGHCDQRGGIQYNIALGERRANAVKKYLTGLGIADERVTVISFGKERPLDSGTSEEAYGKNRRANFVITSK